MKFKKIEEKSTELRASSRSFKLISEMCNLLTDIGTVEDLNRSGILKMWYPNHVMYQIL